VFLSLYVCRVPRLGTRSSPSSSEPFAAECKEFVRSRLIGKQVLVSVEYARGEGGGKRLFASVYYGKPTRQGAVNRPGQNIAEQLVVDGLATTVKHRGDEPRAEDYDMMQVDEAEATRKGRGMHGGQGKAGAGVAPVLNDLATDGKEKGVGRVRGGDKRNI
jgi:staphylococcal nuclease domain-containing protein 1